MRFDARRESRDERLMTRRFIRASAATLLLCLVAHAQTLPPAVYGEWRADGAARTVVLYAHYDGQPTDPRKWTGTQPWEPTLRSAPFERGGTILPMPAEGAGVNPEWRLYARSASDD